MAQLRAAIYARQSITREGSASLDVQIEACRDTAKRLKVEVAAELVEAPSTSGYRNRGRSRPKFQKLLELIRAGEVDCVVAYKADRLSRGGGPGWAPLVDAFEAAGRDPDRTVATTDGWVSEFEIGIRSAMGREESKKTSDRMLAVRAREAKDGIPRLAGRRPYGYSHDMTKHVVAEVSRVKEATQRVLAGESVWSIASDWNDEGVPTVTGRAWTVHTLTSILRSGRIAGLREHKGLVVGEGRWEPIISPDLHERLVVALSPKRKVGGRPRTYPLVGLLRCGKLAARSARSPRENGGRSYACRKGPGLDGCGGIRIQADGVENYLRDLVCGMLADPRTRTALDSLGNDEDDDGCLLIEDLRAVETKRQRLVDLYTDGDIDRASFRARRDELDERARGTEAAMAQRSGRGALVDMPATFEELVETWLARGVEFQRRLTEALLRSITVRPAGARRRVFDPGRLAIEPRG